jgi:hypothetical protein
MRKEQPRKYARTGRTNKRVRWYTKQPHPTIETKELPGGQAKLV